MWNKYIALSVTLAAFLTGQAVPQADSLRASADQGNAGAMVDLGNLYAAGNGLARNYAEAARLYRKAADLGNAEGMEQLGIAYETGQGLAHDDAAAATWYRKSADLGNAHAKFSLAGLYEEGHGVDRDFEEAARWYLASAEAGFAPAMANTGRMYETGAGVKKSYAEASLWYRRAADAGNARGVVYLGMLYESGHAVPQPGGPELQDSALAFGLFQKAAQAGNAEAMYRLAMAYDKGKGTAPDRTQAIAWYRMSAANGFQAAAHALEALAPAGGEVLRVGNGVLSPQVSSRKDPEYTDAARKMLMGGTAMLSLVVDAQGFARDFKLAKPLGFGLDQAAVAAVKTWNFRPGTKGGQPVNVSATIEVTFRLLPGPNGKAPGYDSWKPAEMAFENPDGVSGPFTTSSSPLMKGAPGQSGSATFEFTVNSEGLASGIKVLHASDPSVTDQLAQQLAAWKFGYADKPDIPAGAIGRVRFVLDNGDEDAAKPLFPAR